MRKVAAGLLVLGFASSAFGAQVIFAPNETTVQLGQSASFQVSMGPLTTTGATTITSLDMIIGSDTLHFADGASGVGAFTVAPSFASSFPLNTVLSPASPTVYADDLSVGGFAFAPVTVGAGLAIGTLTVDTTGLAVGDYFIDVSPTLDGGRSLVGFPPPSTVTEGLSGRAIVHVVPEPATISLLGLAALGLIRRRKMA